MTIFTDTIAAGTQLVSATPAILTSTTHVDCIHYNAPLPYVILRANLTNADVIQLHNSVPTYDFKAGAIVNDVIRANAALIPNLLYTRLVADTQLIVSALSRAMTAALSDIMQVHQAETVVRALIVLEGLTASAVMSPTLTYRQIISELLYGHDALLKFLGASVSDAINIAPTQVATKLGYPVAADAININIALSTKLLFKVTASDAIHISPTQALQALYNGTLADGIQVTAGYVAPNGTFTTWAMNTRIAGVTEYQNYAFNSFAQIGNKYLGATSSGLYELTGATDAGANIIATIRSGFAQFAGSKLAMFKGAYLAARSGGSFVLKLITEDGTTSLYTVQSTTDLRSVKIDVGKGLRARYFAFELVSDGTDFDLDSLEFVPLVMQRRV